MQAIGSSILIGVFCLGTMAACSGAIDHPEVGTVSIELLGSASSGAAYRLRDATITVQGPVSAVFNTEDDPSRVRLSVDVTVGQYSASLQDGWQLERIDGSTSTTVAARLLSENPVSFTVQSHQRTAIPLRFQVAAETVEPRSGYDVVLGIEEVAPPPPHPDMFVAIRDSTGHLERIDPATGVASDIGPLGVAYFGGDCAWNPSDSALYVVDGRGGRALYRVSITTGAATLVGMHNVNFMQALAYHPPTNKLYGISGDFRAGLYALSTTTGAATFVRETAGNTEGLVWDSRQQRMLRLRTDLFDVNSNFSDVSELDVVTGESTFLVDLPFLSNDAGMTYNPHTNRVWINAGGGFRSPFSADLKEYDPARFVPSGGEIDPIRSLNSTGYTCIAFVPATQ